MASEAVALLQWSPASKPGNNPVGMSKNDFYGEMLQWSPASKPGNNPKNVNKAELSGSASMEPSFKAGK